MSKSVLRQSERSFQEQIIQYAKLCGWLAHAERPAQYQDGRWRTPIQGDAGFPDLVLVHAERGIVLFAELKAKGRRLTRAQECWAEGLRDVQGSKLGRLQYYTWWPSDWPEIERTLTGQGG